MATLRGRIVFVALTLFIIYFLFIATPTSQSEKDYRQRTQDGLARRRSKLQGDISDQEWTRQTTEKLRAILESHPHGPRGNLNRDGRDSHSAVVNSQEETDDAADIAGASRSSGHTRQNQYSDHSKPRYPKAGVQDTTTDDDDSAAVKKDADVAGMKDTTQKGMGRTSGKKSEDPGKDMVRERLQEYLKKPVVIFSKSYCPHSKRAKQLLTQMYTITPAPLIVELDQLTERIPSSSTSHKNEDDEDESLTLGSKIQDLLNEITGRRTVPNIMVGMHSIGGNDLIWAMHEAGDLAGTITRLGGKRVSVEINSKYAE